MIANTTNTNTIITLTIMGMCLQVYFRRFVFRIRSGSGRWSGQFCPRHRYSWLRYYSAFCQAPAVDAVFALQLLMLYLRKRLLMLYFSKQLTDHFQPWH